MKKALKLRLYPTNAQIVSIENHFGCARYIYNEFLNAKIIRYRQYGISSNYEQDAKEITNLKKDKEFEFLKNVSNNALQSSVRNLNQAYQNFFKKGKGFPKFKKKGVYDSFTLTDKTHILHKNKIKIPKIGEIKCAGFGKNGIQYNVKNVIITKRAGLYFLSFCYDIVEKNKVDIKREELNVVGIDLNIENFLTDSNGNRIENPRIKKQFLNKLKYYQRKISKSKKGSNNRKKNILKLQRTFHKIDNIKKEFLHKTANEYIKNHDVIITEKLQIKNMVKNHKLAEAISMVSWGEFKRILKYKALLHGKIYMEVAPNGTSQMCNNCEKKNEALTLKDRKWTCECGAKHIRDVNAAINIKNKGIRAVVV